MKTRTAPIRSAARAVSRFASRIRSRGEGGATAVEYGLMVALIAAVVIGAVLLLGQESRRDFRCTTRSIAAQTDRC